jgi:RHS repeat-associated protein
VDALGHARYFAYDDADNLVSETDELGATTQYGYDSVRDRTVILNAARGAQYFQYDIRGNQTSAKDPLGRATSYQYNSVGLQEAVTDPAGATSYYLYDPARQRVATLDPLGAPTYFYHDLAGRQKGTVNALGGQSYYVYDLKGWQLASVDELGRASYFYYDKAGRRKGTKDALGSESYYVYDAAGNTVAQVDALGHASYFAYDVLNRQQAAVDALGSATYYEFDAVGNQTAVVDALGNATEYLYDALNRREGQVDSAGAATYYHFDAAGRQTAVLDPLGHATYFEHDVLGRQVAVKNALGNTNYFQHDAAGQQVATVDARGYATYFAYDLAGRQEAVTDALGYTGYFWHDAAGRQTAQVGADGSPTYFAYDVLGRQVAVTDALGSSAYYQYDLAGQQVAQADALGHVTYFYYDVLGRQQAVRDAADGLAYYQYDVLGRRVALVDQRGYASYFAYDALSRLVSELDPLSNASYYQYAADGSLIARTDARGQTAYFEYDAVGRQVTAIYAAVEPVYFGYDLAGNRTRMQDEWGATYWDYDALGRPTRRHDPRGTVVTYAYGEGGHRTELTVEGQGTVYYEYGPTGNMDWLLDGKSELFTHYDYDPADRVTRQQHPNGTTTYFLYDLAGRLSEKVTKKDSGASVLVRFAYTRDAAGNPIAIEREPALGAFYYEYDQLQRLAYEGQFVEAARQYENYYEYDPSGNRTLLRHGETDAENLTYYDYNGANELTRLHASAGWTYFAYDQNGNTVMEQSPGYTRYFDWDGRDMLTGVRSTEQGWTDNEIRYDGLASRAELLDSTGTTRYAWDGIRVLKLEDEEGDLKQRQVHGHAPIPSVGDIALMESADGDPYAPIPDQVGTVCKVLGSAGAVANAYQYDAFGVSRSVSESFANPFRFAGKPLDPDPALYRLTARSYQPWMGRYMQTRHQAQGMALADYGASYINGAQVLNPMPEFGIIVPAPQDWEQKNCSTPPQPESDQCPDGWLLYTDSAREYSNKCWVGRKHKAALSRQFPDLSKTLDGWTEACPGGCTVRRSGRKCFRQVQTRAHLRIAYKSTGRRGWTWTDYYHALNDWDIVVEREVLCTLDVVGPIVVDRRWVYVTTKQVIDGSRDIVLFFDDIGGWEREAPHGPEEQPIIPEEPRLFPEVPFERAL